MLKFHFVIESIPVNLEILAKLYFTWFSTSNYILVEKKRISQAVLLKVNYLGQEATAEAPDPLIKT